MTITVDDFVKLILGLSVAFAIAGIAFQLMRMLGKVTKIVEEVAEPVKNISTLSDYLLEDYNEIRKYIKSILGLIDTVGGVFSSFKFLGSFKQFFGKETKEGEDVNA